MMKILFLFVLFVAATHAEKIVFCYWGTWNVGRVRNVFTIDDVDSTLCTHIAYAFIYVSADGTWVSGQQSVDFGSRNYLTRVQELRQRNPLVKLMASFTGDKTIYSNIAANSTLRATFASSALHFLQDFNFDGLDLDWEFPDATDKENFVLLLEDVRHKLHPNGKIFTIAAAPDETRVSRMYDIPRIVPQVDFINLMTYDFHTSSATMTLLHSKLFAGNDEPSNYYKSLTVAASVEHWIAGGCPSEKLTIGIPMYGRSFTLANSSQTHVMAPTSGPGTAGTFSATASIIQYNEICKNIKLNGWTRNFDNVRMTPYSYKDNQWVGYDDEESLNAKIDLVFNRNLGGVMFWANDKDDFEGNCGNGKNPMQTLAYKRLVENNN